MTKLVSDPPSTPFYYLRDMGKREDIHYLRRVLLNWFSQNRRTFPWREGELTNYQLIFTEILLQRTQADTVAKYFDTFFNRYPGWDELSRASLSELEEILRPLGLYKHRAKRIYKVVSEFNERQGSLPRNRGELQESSLASLYISNAYELFVLSRRAALLDVNMARVLRRYLIPGEAVDVRLDSPLQALAREVVNVKRCKDLNWAILDFAAMICKARNPRCSECPLKVKCRHFNENLRCS